MKYNMINNKKIIKALFIVSLLSLGMCIIDFFGIESINPFYYFLRTPYDIEKNVRKK